MNGPDELPLDWVRIRAEYELGQLSNRDLARIHGISEAAIRKRAKAGGWVKSESVPKVVKRVAKRKVRSETRTSVGLRTNANQCEIVEAPTPEPDVNWTHLVGFERLIKLIHRHRSFLFGLDQKWRQLFADLEKFREKRSKDGRSLTLKEIQLIAQILSSATYAIGKQIPLERRAFGLTDQEGPSEIDALTDDEVARLDELIQQAKKRAGR